MIGSEWDPLICYTNNPLKANEIKKNKNKNTLNKSPAIIVTESSVTSSILS